MNSLRVMGVCALLFGSIGCGAFEQVFDKVTLSDEELQAVADNYTAVLEAFNDLEEFAVDLANGELETDDALTFTAPAAENNWTGTMEYVGADLPGGDGELLVTFRIVQDGVAINPFETDLSTTELLTAEITVDFDGLTRKGVPMTFVASFTTSYDRAAAPGKEDIITDGTFSIDHGGYTAELTASAFTLRVDVETSTAENASGSIRGLIDIPDFAFDADVDIIGRGEVIHVEVDALDQTIDEGDIPVADF